MDDRVSPSSEGEPEASGSEEASAAKESSEAGSIGRPTVGFGHALSWSYVLTGGRLGVTLVVSLVLARILGPEAFGLVAMGLAFIALVELLVKQGLTTAIIQRPGLRNSHLDAAFWMTVGAVLLLTPLVLLLSGWWAGVNDTPALQPILVWLSILVPLKGLGVVVEATVMRQMDFRSLALRTGLATLTGGVIGITAALLGAGVWALVAQQLTMATLELVLVWKLSTWRPGLTFQPQRAKELLSFSSNMTVASFAGFVERQSDSLLIGIFFGPVVVGLYRMARRLVSVVTELASGAVRTTFLPELMKFEDDREAFLARSLELLRVSMMLALPLLGGMFVVARPALALLGDDWLPALTALQLLAITATLGSLSMFTGPLLQAIGRPGVFASVTIASGTASVLAFLAAGLLLADGDPSQQVTTVAAARSLASASVFLVLILPILSRVVGIQPTALARGMAPTVAAVVAGGVVVTVARAVAGDAWPDNSVVDLLGSGTLYIAPVIAMLLVLEPLARRIGARIAARAGISLPTAT